MINLRIEMEMRAYFIQDGDASFLDTAIELSHRFGDIRGGDHVGLVFDCMLRNLRRDREWRDEESTISCEDSAHLKMHGRRK